MNYDLDVQTQIDDYHLITEGRGVYFQSHVPQVMDEPYHAHPSIEINFLQGCDMTYSFSGQEIQVPRERFCIFWAAQPHRVLDISGSGRITNAYVSLEEFWSWPLPAEFVNALLSGCVLTADRTFPDDIYLISRLSDDALPENDIVGRLHCLELQARITRLALTGWDQALRPKANSDLSRIGGSAIVHFEKMLRYIATYYTEAITLGDVAKAAGVSENYANTLSKKIIGTTIKSHITNVRIHRARALLAGTDNKIISIALDSGFRSLSSFYEAFQQHVGTSPANFRAEAQNQ